MVTLTRKHLEQLLACLPGKSSDLDLTPLVDRSLPDEPRVPPELCAIPESKTSHLQALRKQLIKAVPATGQRDRVHQFLSSLLDYVSYMCEALDQSENSRIACELDRKIAAKIRGDIIPTIRNFCNDIKSVTCEQCSDDVITKSIEAVKSAESRVAQAKDVSSKKRLIHELWEKSLSALKNLRSGRDTLEQAQAKASASEEVKEKVQLDLKRESEAIEAARSDALGLRSHLTECQDKGDKVLNFLQEDVKKQEEEEQEALQQYHTEREHVLRILLPLLQPLVQSHQRAEAAKRKADELRRMQGICEREWKERRKKRMEEMDSNLDKFCGSLERYNKVIESFHDGAEHVLAAMNSSSMQLRENLTRKQSRWSEQLAALHEQTFLSLSEAQIRNEALLEEWSSESQALHEALEAAVERLDSVEESKIKEQQRTMERRVKEVLEENKEIEKRVAAVETLFKPVLEDLQRGRIGFAVSREAMASEGMRREEWVFSLGERLVRDLRPSLDALRLRVRQQRLEQLRRNHKREFEVIRKMKEQLDSEMLPFRSPPARLLTFQEDRENSSDSNILLGKRTGGAFSAVQQKRGRVDEQEKQSVISID
ncbi:hypothetical protein GUITHDRAFT_122431 [Guillardia theta CCMP2712]|uniref:Uncharacterized protein n=2 Tax=Guillardia theta TaxID=55529 RepID=L1I572_GUITC|nr:hypothetical protein GUITHDRAFT_122431 [Guillardia theta CCMP2712]EKX31371.1 hypothetical protein GUITHDRAFT_122431 [Guillardia theta CCMP2712]|eukprot:XP_005818351.1 hypothetical protein GUITHDRAFT_122431 [Guillardia theta CCMP2712]